ncbi:ABC transporter ATP-binding protein [Candidatus Woesearchaeota archaeon]|nr:ABC transporter ATP-binding protein [Candidatus Woesearchaeota archaeon]
MSLVFTILRGRRKRGGELSELFFRVRNLKKAFGKNLVLSGVNLDVYKGEVIGIIGTSGSGKTTLLHVMIGFLNPDIGEVRVLLEPSHRALGEPTYKDVHKNLSMAKRVFGFASQVPSFYNDLTVTENMQYYASLYEMPKHTIKTNMQILLHLMDLELAKKSLGKNLSGGMERRLDIACALMHDPAVLILDEPTADLDPVLRNHIYDLIRKINNKETTIILASHHLSDLERVCDRIAILKEGKIFAIGTLDDIKNQFSDYHQVQVSLAGGQYHEVEEEMKQEARKLFIKSQAFNNGLIFYTNKPQDCAKHVMKVASKLKEKVDDLHIGKPSLDDVFITIMEEDHQEKEGRSVRTMKRMEPRKPKDARKKELSKEERNKEQAKKKRPKKQRKKRKRRKKTKKEHPKQEDEKKQEDAGGKPPVEEEQDEDKRSIEEWLRETGR